jgi:hypothetical protein
MPYCIFCAGESDSGRPVATTEAARRQRYSKGDKHLVGLGSAERIDPGGVAMSHYRSNVRDLEFNLFEALNLEQVLADEAFGDLDGDSVHQMLSEAARLAEGPVAESFAESDPHTPTFDTGTQVVTLPEPFKK